MKLLYISALLLLVGCTFDQTKIESSYEKVDSIIQESKINLIKSDSINRESEKAIAEKVSETLTEMRGLREEARVAKMAVKTVIKVDTVYVETKKNFWGKTKTNTTIKSDSTETVDSLENR